MVELGLAVTSVDKTDFAVANLVLKRHCVFVNDDESIVAGIRDDNKISVEV